MNPIVSWGAEETITDENELTKTQTLRKEYWSEFLKYANENSSEYASYFSGRKTPSTDKWYNFFFGASDCHLVVEQTRTRKELSLGLNFEKTSENFHALESQKDAIEAELGFSMEWQEKPDRKSSYIVEITNNVDFDDASKRKEQFDFIISRLLTMRRVFAKYLNL